MDIQYPTMYNWNGLLSEEELEQLLPWAERNDTLLFRGATTGGHYNPNPTHRYRSEDYSKYVSLVPVMSLHTLQTLAALSGQGWPRSGQAVCCGLRQSTRSLQRMRCRQKLRGTTSTKAVDLDGCAPTHSVVLQIASLSTGGVIQAHATYGLPIHWYCAGLPLSAKHIPRLSVNGLVSPPLGCHCDNVQDMLNVTECVTN